MQIQKQIYLKWLQNYLTDRKQVVALEGSSPTLQVLSDVPQGSVLGPLLFIIYLNSGVARILEKKGQDCARNARKV